MSGLRLTFVFGNFEKMAEFVIDKWRDISSEAIGSRGFFSVALSGGKTPVKIYRRLAGEVGKGLLRRKTHIFFVDERFVPATDKDSNYRMIRETLLDGAGVPMRNIHSLNTNLPDPASAAERYERDIASFFKLSGHNIPEFDLIMLGIGVDGHTASLFPGSPALEEKKRLASAVIFSGKKHSRITLTLPVLNKAKHVIFLVTGKRKAEVLRAVIQESDPSLPASLVAPDNGNLLYLADSNAGSLLREKEKKRV
ncbi:6-phosphogluconolactonase [Candidatus Sulfobium mesophilum]|uniref:6-phosphogluconolactonase n=1 Tax=Candidatus Sulfobium mesophilum TaxID=2016548 RepID=A0A2U3QG37_9BACT|nr:6-phosphogluconolactonase [Candidatus Sulfobium mesophilum]